MRRLVVAVLLFCLVDTALAQSGNVVGIGTGTCGDFAGHYRRDSKTYELLYFTWAQGFISATNLTLYFGKQETYQLDPNSVEVYQAFVRRFCDQHPLKAYVDAVVALLSTLKKVPPQLN